MIHCFLDIALKRRPNQWGALALSLLPKITVYGGFQLFFQVFLAFGLELGKIPVTQAMDQKPDHGSLAHLGLAAQGCEAVKGQYLGVILKKDSYLLFGGSEALQRADF